MVFRCSVKIHNIVLQCTKIFGALYKSITKSYLNASLAMEIFLNLKETTIESEIIPYMFQTLAIIA